MAAGVDYVDEPYLTIRWDETHQHVLSEWKAFANSRELRAALLSGINAIQDHKAVAYISDARKLKVIVCDDQAWIKDTWKPLASAAGLKRLAYVTAPTGLGRMNVEDLSKSLDENGLESCTFHSIDAAREWLNEILATATAGRRARGGST